MQDVWLSSSGNHSLVEDSSLVVVVVVDVVVGVVQTLEPEALLICS